MSLDDLTTIRYEVVDPGEHGIAVVTLDRPKANAIDAATSYALGEVFVGFEHDPDVRVAIFTGAGVCAAAGAAKPVAA